MRRLIRALDRVRGSDLPAVIQGETGSGKELVARLVHAQGKRYGGPFIVIDLRAIPAHLIDVELFGARAGAFTDLARDRPGLLAAASGGTVLIDEIGEAGPELQARFLRVLSSGAARPVGSTEESPIDARFIFTTTRSLEEEARAGRLRPDLLHRIRVVSIEVPPLRERADDIPGLVDIFFGEGEGSVPEIEGEVLSRLKSLPWPGNARELRNLVALWRVEGHRRITRAILEGSLPSSAPASSPFPASLLASESLPALKDSLEREYLRHHFRRLGGDAAMLARSLGVSRKHLYRRLKQLGISVRGMAKGKG
jgi:DNA-binding NtrC family response regulator